MLNLFLTFFKIGLFTTGGGYAMIPLIQDFVIKNSWATNEELLEFIAISESTPGPFAINISTFIGFKNNSILGSLLSTIGVILPSFIIILLIAKNFDKFKKIYVIEFILSNLRPVVISLLIFSILIIFHKTFNFNDNLTMIQIIIFSIMIFIKIIFKPSPIKIILLSGVLGIFFM